MCDGGNFEWWLANYQVVVVVVIVACTSWLMLSACAF